MIRRNLMKNNVKEIDVGIPPVEQNRTCGIIMPISAIDGCPADHWSDVKAIIQEAIDSISSPKFVAKLVSEADDVGIIQKRIVQGVYASDVVVCDVSGKNANVMFELGLRLAFDKPTIIIKDENTDYSFDTSVIEHLAYPRDLRFSRVVAFKKQLAEKVLATHLAAQANPEHSTFLRSFGTFKVSHLEEKEASGEQVMLEMLSEIQREIAQFRRSQTPRSRLGQVDGVASIVGALVELKLKNPDLVLEPTDEMVERILDFKNVVARDYETKKSFIDALAQACNVANALQ